MDKNNKESFMAMPIEKHDTAAWANIANMKPICNVSIPSEVEVRNAKEWVDTNQNRRELISFPSIFDLYYLSAKCL